MASIEHERRIADVLALALKRPPWARGDFIARECARSPDILREVKQRLSEYERTETFPAIASAANEAALGSEESGLPKNIGRYVLQGIVGRGGFGQVFRAFDPNVGRVVAIKVMNAPVDSDVRRFQVEAKTVANLQHKNIVTVHEFGQERGVPYLVMEYLEGTSLLDLIRGNALTLLEKLEIMTQAAEGLHHAHDHGVIHRDIKPANIMRIDDGSVKIMDFGIARIAESSTRLTRTGFIVGTLAYMAPEQFNGTSDAQSDIFSYGVTFYELLTGKNPFDAGSAEGTIFRITNTDAPPVRSQLPGCPEALNSLLGSTLDRSRKARCRSLADVVADLKPVLLQLRREQAGACYEEARQFLLQGQLEQAKLAVRKVLDLDPSHPTARQLRTDVEEALRRREESAHASSLLSTAEELLDDQQYEKASALLEEVRRFDLNDGPLRRRLERNEAKLARLRRLGELVDAAREKLRNRDLPGAFRSAAEALSEAPENSEARALVWQIRDRIGAEEQGAREDHAPIAEDGRLQQTPSEPPGISSNSPQEALENVDEALKVPGDHPRLEERESLPALRSKSGGGEQRLENPRSSGPAGMEKPIAPLLEAATRGSHRGTRWRFSVKAGLAVAGIILLVGAWQGVSAYRLFQRGQEFEHDVLSEKIVDPAEIWTRWEELSKGDSSSMFLRAPRAAAKEKFVADADHVIDTYRNDAQTVHESDWQSAHTMLLHALSLDPDDKPAHGKLRICEGHLARINGVALHNVPTLNDAAQKFNEAQQLMPRSPDPALGIARVYLSLGDVDKATTAIHDAETNGYALGNRERAQLADGYRERADRTFWDSRSVRGLPQEKQQIQQAADDYQRALELYQKSAGWGNSNARIGQVQTSLESINTRFQQIEQGAGQDETEAAKRNKVAGSMIQLMNALRDKSTKKDAP